MLTVRKLRELYGYDEWAMSRLLDAMEGLTPQQLAREFAGPTTSLRNRTAHLLETLVFWWGLCNVDGRGDEPIDAATVAELKSAHRIVGEYVRASLDRLTDQRLAEPIVFRDGSTGPPIGECLRHVVYHGTYHRGQIATLLTLHGVDFPDTDYDEYLMEKL